MVVQLADRSVIRVEPSEQARRPLPTDGLKLVEIVDGRDVRQPDDERCDVGRVRDPDVERAPRGWRVAGLGVVDPREPEVLHARVVRVPDRSEQHADQEDRTRERHREVHRDRDEREAQPVLHEDRAVQVAAEHDGREVSVDPDRDEKLVARALAAHERRRLVRPRHEQHADTEEQAEPRREDEENQVESGRPDEASAAGARCRCNARHGVPPRANSVDATLLSRATRMQ